MDPDLFWHSVGGGAVIAALLTLARLLLDYSLRSGERRIDQDERRRGQQRDAEARLERILQDRLADADRRLQHADAELLAERVRAGGLERELFRVQQAYNLLKVEYANLLEAEEARRLAR